MKSAWISRVQAKSRIEKVIEALKPATTPARLLITPSRCGPTLCSAARLRQLPKRAAKRSAREARSSAVTCG